MKRCYKRPIEDIIRNFSQDTEKARAILFRRQLQENARIYDFVHQTVKHKPSGKCGVCPTCLNEGKQ